ncbi:MAG: hypothetical protein IKM65_05090, partial [Bacteroidaceae bacterium]|nr:hypothetical protein [Bacteroidaceae bacterium]
EGEELKNRKQQFFINIIELLSRYAPAPLCRKRSGNNAFLNSHKKPLLFFVIKRSSRKGEELK